MELKNKLTKITEKAEVWFNKIIKNLPIEIGIEKGK